MSCAREEDIFEHERVPAQSEYVFGSELADEQLLSRMNIRVSDDLAIRLEEATSESGDVNLKPFKSLTGQGVVKMRRLFPDAGKFEERTRAEGLHKWYVLTYEEGHSMTKASDGLMIEGVDEIEYCPRIAVIGDPEVVEVVPASTKAGSNGVFDDPMLDQQWHYYNNGTAFSSVSGCDINVIPAWRNYSTYHKYKGDIIVSIVDGGIDYKHEDLQANMWKNPDKTGENVYGYNFASKTFVVTPDDHGTHVAGTIAAVNNNGVGVCGVAGGDTKKKLSGAKLMSCQIFDGNKAGSGAEAIKWGADHGAVISQNSWGYPDLHTMPSSVKAAVDYFEKYAGLDENGRQVGPMKGGLVIFAAGNEGRSTSSNDYEKVLTVTSVGADYKRAYYSNYGEWADIAAPGGDAKKGNYVLSEEAAKYFYIALVGDSGRFQYSSTSPHTFAIAQELLKTGINISKIYHEMYEKCIDDLAVTAHILNNFHVSEYGVAYYVLPLDIQEKLHITTERGKENVNLLSNIRGINAWCSITEDSKEPCWRVSIRSKEKAINGVAAMFEGGGHAQASGAKLNSLDDLPRFIEALDNLFK